MLRILGAFVVAPFPVALLQSVAVGVWPKPGSGVFEHPASMFVVMCLYFYAVGLLLGVPGWLLVRRRSPGLKAYALLGLADALLPAAAGLAVAASLGEVSAYIVVYNIMLFGLGGAAAGALFWRFVVRRRPPIDLEGTFG